MINQIIGVKLQSETDSTFHYNVDARVIEETDKTFIIKYLNETEKLYEKCIVFRFDREVSEVDKECVDCYYETTNVEDAGYEKIEGVGYILADTSDCWVPYSSSESESDEDN